MFAVAPSRGFGIDGVSRRRCDHRAVSFDAGKKQGDRQGKEHCKLIDEEEHGNQICGTKGVGTYFISTDEWPWLSRGSASLKGKGKGGVHPHLTATSLLRGQHH